MDGPGRKHYYVTAVISCKDPEYWPKVLRVMNNITDEEMQRKFSGFGILILNSLPDFMSDKLPKALDSTRDIRTRLAGILYVAKCSMPQTRIIDSHRAKSSVYLSQAMSGK